MIDLLRLRFWLINWLIYWLIDRLTYWLNDWFMNERERLLIDWRIVTHFSDYLLTVHRTKLLWYWKSLFQNIDTIIHLNVWAPRECTLGAFHRSETSKLISTHNFGLETISTIMKAQFVIQCSFTKMVILINLKICNFFCNRYVDNQ